MTKFVECPVVLSVPFLSLVLYTGLTYLFCFVSMSTIFIGRSQIIGMASNRIFGVCSPNTPLKVKRECILDVVDLFFKANWKHNWHTSIGPINYFSNSFHVYPGPKILTLIHVGLYARPEPCLITNNRANCWLTVFCPILHSPSRDRWYKHRLQGLLHLYQWELHQSQSPAYR